MKIDPNQNVSNIDEQTSHSRNIGSMFSQIAKHYDLMNSLMSFGKHHSWRKKLIDLSLPLSQAPSLDIATGTGDMIVELLKNDFPQTIVGIDISKNMIDEAKKKIPNTSTSDIILLLGDAHTLPFQNDFFGFVTITFGIRNFHSPNLALNEFKRVLKPGGKIAILDIFKSEKSNVSNFFFQLYFKLFPPILGKLVAQNQKAYQYLPKSVDNFTTAKRFSEQMINVGLQIIETQPTLLHHVNIIVAKKPN